MKPIVWCLLGALAARAQTPLIRTETRLVLVDAVVTDKSGRPVGDLTATDFKIWEDGKEQPVRNATFGNPEGSSYVVLLFDNATLDPASSNRAREAAVRFVDANAGPGHWMAVADFGPDLRTSQNFTSDTERLKRVILESIRPATNGTMSAVPGRGGRVGMIGRNAPDSETVERNLNAFGLALRELARNLSNVPARKMVVLFSASPAVKVDSLALSYAIATFDRWNVSVYPVAAADTDLPAPFYALAKGTGGFVSANSHDLVREMERLRHESSGYYSLSYVPAETPDGSCHSLRVKIDRPGVELRARNEYCNVKAVDLLSGTAAEKEMDNRAAGDQRGSLTAALQLPYFYAEPNLARLHMAMEIPTKNVTFAKVKTKFHAEVQLLAVAVQADGAEGARFSDTVKLDFNRQEEVDAFLKQPLHYEGQFEVASGSYTLKVVLATGGENFGKLETPLTIDPYDGKKLMLSGLALSKQIRSLADPGQVQEAQLLEGVAPLIFQDLRLVPTGDNWLRKSDPAAIYGEAYQPAGDNPPPVELRLKIVDEATGKASSSGISHVDAFRPGEFLAIPFALRLDVATLPPGRYRAEVEAVTPAGSTPARSVVFEVR